MASSLVRYILRAVPLGLQRREEALHRRVVPDVAGSAHRAGDAVVGHQPLELLAGVLAALIRVVQQGIRLAASPDRHDQRVGDELRRHAGAHRPADHPAREQIDDGGHIEPALRGPDVGEVGNPLPVGSRCFEAAVEHIGSDGGRLPLTQIGRQAPPSRTRSESLQPHQSLDPVQSAGYPLGEQIVPHPPGTIGPVAREEAGTDLRADILIAPAALTARSCQPRIKPTPRDTERPAQPFRRPDPRCFAMKPNFISIPSRSRPRLFLGYPVRPSAWQPRA